MSSDESSSSESTSLSDDSTGSESDTIEEIEELTLPQENQEILSLNHPADTATNHFQNFIQHLQRLQEITRHSEEVLRVDIKHSSIIERQNSRQCSRRWALLDISTQEQTNRLAQLDTVESSSEASEIEFICPITREPYRDPVILLEDGFTYSRAALRQALAVQPNVSPKTGQALTSTTFYSNQAIRNQDTICPITQEQFQEPYWCSEDGRTYEKSAITRYYELKIHEFAEAGHYPPFIVKSPACGIILNSITLYPNKALYPPGSTLPAADPIKVDIAGIIEDIIPFINVPIHYSGRTIHDVEIRNLILSLSQSYKQQEGYESNRFCLDKIHERRRELGLAVDAYRGNWGPIIDLSGLDLSNMCFDGLFIKNVNLIGVNFENSQLINCKFLSCKLIQCNLSRTIINHCEFSGEGLSFFRTNFNQAQIQGSSLSKDLLRTLGAFNAKAVLKK